jgi:acetylornithine/succinyldiaminopimelate/putrescine aminotransferase
VAKAVDETVCAVMLEPVQGEGGVNLPSPDYLKGLRQLCDANGLLLILDEIQAGLSRTGKLFAYENFGITPDVMTLAKGLANGLPMGALLATEEVALAFVPGTHASTFGAGPVVAAAAKTAVGLLSRPEFLAGVRDLGEFLRLRLADFQSQFPIVKEVRGLGLMWGIELTREGGDVVTACRERGLLINCTQGNVIRLLPPLVVTTQELDKGLAILGESLQAVFP